MENRIGELRREKGLTLKELGEKLEIKDNTLSQYETGKRNPPITFLKETATFFGVSLDYLLKNTEKRDFDISTDEEAMDLFLNIHNGMIPLSNLTPETIMALSFWYSTVKFQFDKKQQEDYYQTIRKLTQYLFKDEKLAFIRESNKKAFRNIEDYTSEDNEKSILFDKSLNLIYDFIYNRNPALYDYSQFYNDDSLKIVIKIAIDILNENLTIFSELNPFEDAVLSESILNLCKKAFDIHLYNNPYTDENTFNLLENIIQDFKFGLESIYINQFDVLPNEENDPNRALKLERTQEELNFKLYDTLLKDIEQLKEKIDSYSHNNFKN